MEKQQFMNRKWGYKILLSTAGSCFVMISQVTLLGQGYISITSSLHVLYNIGYTRLILIIRGHSYHPIVFQDINWFSCFQIFICPNYFYREQYLSAWGKLLRRKTICWYRGYVRNTPWWWYNDILVWCRHRIICAWLS